MGFCEELGSALGGEAEVVRPLERGFSVVDDLVSKLNSACEPSIEGSKVHAASLKLELMKLMAIGWS